MRPFEHAKIIRCRVECRIDDGIDNVEERVRNARTRPRHQRLKRGLLGAKSGRIQIGKIVRRDFQRLALRPQPRARCIKSAIHAGSLQGDNASQPPCCGSKCFHESLCSEPLGSVARRKKHWTDLRSGGWGKRCRAERGNPAKKEEVSRFQSFRVSRRLECIRLAECHWPTL